MNANKPYLHGLAVLKSMRDRDWMTILSALLRDDTKEGQQLGQHMLKHTKHGRQIQLLRKLHDTPLTVAEIQKQLKTSRRSVFRDFLELESHGVRMVIGDGWRYELQRVPESLARLIK